MTDFDQVKNFLENAAKANAEALKLQMQFFQDNAQRQSATFSKLAEDQVKAMQAMASGGDIKAAMEQNMAFNEEVKQQLDALQQDSTAAYEQLVADLKAAYNVDQDG